MHLMDRCCTHKLHLAVVMVVEIGAGMVAGVDDFADKEKDGCSFSMQSR